MRGLCFGLSTNKKWSLFGYILKKNIMGLGDVHWWIQRKGGARVQILHFHAVSAKNLAK